MSPKQPDAVDRLVGRNIRIQRLAKGLSQTELATQLGVTFQQVQKYEKGVNRIGCGRLFQIASILGVHVMDFFEGSGKAKAASARTPASPTVQDLISEPQSFHLVQAFSEINDRRLRSSVVDLVKKIARAQV
jgi:transcriptional regulator with XRE-family HTH domain